MGTVRGKNVGWKRDGIWSLSGTPTARPATGTTGVRRFQAVCGGQFGAAAREPSGWSCETSCRDGRVAATLFLWEVVSLVAAGVPYSGSGRKAQQSCRSQVTLEEDTARKAGRGSCSRGRVVIGHGVG